MREPAPARRPESEWQSGSRGRSRDLQMLELQNAYFGTSTTFAVRTSNFSGCGFDFQPGGVLEFQTSRRVGERSLQFKDTVSSFWTSAGWAFELRVVVTLRCRRGVRRSAQIGVVCLNFNRSAFEVRRSGAVCQLWSAKCRDVHTSDFVRVPRRYQTPVLRISSQRGALL